MGEAGVDLPDPLTTPPLGQTPNTDDLLAQMAGEEIDRLLADAEAAPRNPLKQPAPETLSRLGTDPSPSLPEEDPDPEINKQLDVLFDELSAPATAAAEAVSPSTQVSLPTEIQPPPSPVSQEDDDSQLQQELDNLFNELTAPEPPPAPATVAPEQVSEVSRVAAALVDAPLPSPMPELGLDPEQQTGPAELQVLAEPIPEPASSLETAHPPDPPPQRVSLLVRILELFNAPMALFPDSARDALGKIAIMTLINAILVLAYVAFFRRH